MSIYPPTSDISDIYIYIYIRYPNVFVLIYNRIIDMLMYTYTHSKSFIQLRSIDLRMLHYSMPQSTHGATSSPHLSGTYSASRAFRKDGFDAVRDWHQQRIRCCQRLARYARQRASDDCNLVMCASHCYLYCCNSAAIFGNGCSAHGAHKILYQVQ
jgi:hypothetical protein